MVKRGKESGHIVCAGNLTRWQMQRAFFSIIFGLLVSSGANADFPEDTYFPLDVTKETVSRLWAHVTEQVGDRVFDPSSVQFRCITVLELEPDDGFIVSGGFNAKNLYGGYVGFKSFSSFVGADLAHKFTLLSDRPDSVTCESYRKLRESQAGG